MSRIVHFCSYFMTSSVYADLAKSISCQHAGKQVIFYPRRENELDLNKNLLKDKKIDLVSEKCLNLFTKINPIYKLFKIYLSSRRIIENSAECTIVHAHTLYGDGLAAFLFAKRRRHKLVITLRGTDVNIGFRVFFILKPLAKAALRYSDTIIFVSPSHRYIFEKYFGSSMINKFRIIPNGLKLEFADNTLNSKLHVNSTARVGLYVGRPTRNKNILNSILAFKEASMALDGQNCDWLFKIVGMSNEDFVTVYGRLPIDIVSNVLFVNRIDSADELKEHYDSADVFVMPSFSETFGLTYIEAISRCVPIVCMAGQGVDGYFGSTKVGSFALNGSVEAVKNSVLECYENFPSGLQFNAGKNPAHFFGWSDIAKEYSRHVYFGN